MGKLKSGWRRVKLGAIIERHVERAEDITRYPRFVGVDDLDTDDLRLRRHGTTSIDEVPPTFRYVFRAGMILVPTRRPRLRKCALAPFDGLTGEKVLVLKPKNGSGLDPVFAPYLLSSPPVQDWNIENAIGSVTPHFRWGDMSECEVALPPPEEQRLMCRQLAASAEVVARCETVAHSSNSILDATLLHLLGDSLEDRPLQSLCRTPVTYGIVKAGIHVEVGVPYVRVADITASPRLGLDGMLRTSAEISRAYERTILEEGDIVIAVKASRGVVGQVRQVSREFRDGNISRDVARISPHRNLDATYVYWALRSPQVMRSIQQRETGWKGDSLREITIAALRTVPVPWLPEQKQQHFGQTMSRLEEVSLAATKRLREARAMHHLVINRIFGEDCRSSKRLSMERTVV